MGITREICNAQRPRKFYCSFDQSCKENCSACGWKSAADRAFSECVVATPTTCYADNEQMYCASDERCHPPGDCSNCIDRPERIESRRKLRSDEFLWGVARGTLCFSSSC